MEGVDRLNELSDEFLVNNIMSRLDGTTKKLIRTTATISKRWKNLWTQLPHLNFSIEDDVRVIFIRKPVFHDYFSFIDNTLNQCPTNLNLKKFKLYIPDAPNINSKFDSRPNNWIRYAISRNVEEVDLSLWDTFTYDDELFFNNLCFNRVKLSDCEFKPPNGVISWGRLKCLRLSRVTLDEDMIKKILSGSPCLESLELDNCYGYRRIDITSKSVKKLVFSEYNANYEYCTFNEGYVDCIKINAPHISYLTIEGMLVLRQLVLLNVSSLVKAHLAMSKIQHVRIVVWSEPEISEEEVSEEDYSEEVFGGLLESLGHVKDITFGNHCLEFLSRL